MSDLYDLEQVRVARGCTKTMARHVCYVSHPVFGRYEWLDEHCIDADLLDDMLWDALTLLERQVEVGTERSERTMSGPNVPWEEHLAVVRRVGRLEGAIEAHRILLGKNMRREDEILYGLVSTDD